MVSYNSTSDNPVEASFQSGAAIETNETHSNDPKFSTYYLLRSTNAHILNRRALLSYRGLLGLIRLFYNAVMFVVVFGLTVDSSKGTCKMGLYWPVTYLIVTGLAIVQLAPHVRGVTILDYYFFGFWTKQRVLAFHQVLAFLFVLFSIMLPFLFSQTVPKCPLVPRLNLPANLSDSLGYNTYVYKFTTFVTVISYLEILLFTPIFTFLLHFGKLDYILRYSPLHNGVSTETIVNQLPTFTYNDESTYLEAKRDGEIPVGLPLNRDQPGQIGPMCLCCHKHYFLGDDVIRLNCRHDFHASCIQSWLKVENCCPVCQLNAIPFEQLDPSRDYNENSAILGGAAGVHSSYSAP